MWKGTTRDTRRRGPGAPSDYRLDRCRFASAAMTVSTANATSMTSGIGTRRHHMATSRFPPAPASK